MSRSTPERVRTNTNKTWAKTLWKTIARLQTNRTAATDLAADRFALFSLRFCARTCTLWDASNRRAKLKPEIFTIFCPLAYSSASFFVSVRFFFSLFSLAVLLLPFLLFFFFFSVFYLHFFVDLSFFSYSDFLLFYLPVQFFLPFGQEHTKTQRSCHKTWAWSGCPSIILSVWLLVYALISAEFWTIARLFFPFTEILGHLQVQIIEKIGDAVTHAPIFQNYRIRGTVTQKLSHLRIW